MSRLIKDYVWRIQLVFWILIVGLGLAVGFAQLDRQLITFIAIVALILLIGVNLLHFYKIDYYFDLTQITPFLAPSVWASLFLQIVVSVVLIDGLFLSNLVVDLSTSILQLISTIVYIIAGIVLSVLNVLAPALYRYQDLRQQALKADELQLEQRYKIAQLIIQKHILAFDFIGELRDLEKMNPDQIRHLLSPLLTNVNSPLMLQEMITLERWLGEKIKEQERERQPISYVWAAAISTTVIVGFELISRILSVLNLVRSVQSP